jgi:hypothetical protein
MKRFSLKLAIIKAGPSSWHRVMFGCLGPVHGSETAISPERNPANLQRPWYMQIHPNDCLTIDVMMRLFLSSLRPRGFCVIKLVSDC